MAFLMLDVSDDLKAKLDRIAAGLAELGVDSNNGDFLSYVLEEGADLIAPGIEQDLRRHRFLQSFDKENQSGKDRRSNKDQGLLDSGRGGRGCS